MLLIYFKKKKESFEQKKSLGVKFRSCFNFQRFFASVVVVVVAIVVVIESATFREEAM